MSNKSRNPIFISPKTVVLAEVKFDGEVIAVVLESKGLSDS